MPRETVRFCFVTPTIDRQVCLTLRPGLSVTWWDRAGGMCVPTVPWPCFFAKSRVCDAVFTATGSLSIPGAIMANTAMLPGTPGQVGALA